LRDRIVEKDVRDRAIRKAAGRHPNAPQQLAGQSSVLGNDAERRVLPECVDDLDPLMDANGDFYFMAGYSVVGGPDKVRG
jgi:hypothetical protein